MAPVYSHFLQYRQLVLPPRPAKGPSGGIRPVKSVFGYKTFMAVFAASFVIFVLAVLCWKSGACFRTFSRRKILGGGKEAGVRYAKTWYGWIPLEKYKKHQEKRREWLGRVRAFFSWRTCHTDYSWVWWDPDGKKWEKRSEDLKPLRWIPSAFVDRTFSPKHSVNNSRAVSIQEPGPTDRPPTPSCALPGENAVFVDGPPLPVVQKRPKRSRRPNVSQDRHPLSSNNLQVPRPDFTTRGNIDFPGSRFSTNISSTNKRCNSLPHIAIKCTLKRDSSTVVVRRCISDGERRRVSTFGSYRRNYPLVPTQRQHTPMVRTEASTDMIPPENHLSWRYKAWGARMQRTAFPDTPFGLQGLAGRPGTPFPEAIRSLISTRTGSDHLSATRVLRHRSLSDSSPRELHSRTGHAAMISSQYSNIPTDGHSENGHSAYYIHQPASRNRYQSLRDHSRQNSCEPGPSTFLNHSTRKPPNAVPLIHRRISNPEVRLVDDLERKLEWLSSEMAPGRLTYDFALVHNHWLNKATWSVYDPPCRVSCAERRIYGDPRFNYPWPPPGSGRPNPLSIRRKRDRVPKLDSWRVAINAARRSVGVREFLKAVEAFSGSIEEPPDGAIDTATWVLKRPPQGFEMSSKQKDAFYEGGGGWCEKLDYWQKVPRGYRARMVVCEGRVNRRRVAEVARQVSGSCKKTVSKIGPLLSGKHTLIGDGRVIKIGRISSLGLRPKKQAVQEVHYIRPADDCGPDSSPPAACDPPVDLPAPSDCVISEN